jgi:hypothetical protein
MVKAWVSDPERFARIFPLGVDGESMRTVAELP